MLAVVLARRRSRETRTTKPDRPALQEARDAVGQRSDLGFGSSVRGSRPVARELPARPHRARPGRQMAAGVRTGERRPTSRPGSVHGHGPRAQPSRGPRRRSRRTTSSTTRSGSSGTATSRSTMGASYWPVHPARARPLPADVARQRAPLGGRARRLHARSWPTAGSASTGPAIRATRRVTVLGFAPQRLQRSPRGAPRSRR